MERVRVGFVGAGRIADLQCLGWLDHPHASIVAVCDADRAVARERADAWGADAAYERLDDLLADPRVDAVEILTPHHLHADHAVAALRAGKHVSLQKPPVTTLAEWDRVCAAAAASGRTLRVFENFMYYPPHVLARRLLGEGAIGQPLSLRLETAAGRPEGGWTVPPAALAWRMDAAACGGGPTTFDHGYHCYAMARWLLDAEIARVHAFVHWTDFGGGARYDGPALVSWEYAGDVPRYGSWEVVASLGMRVRSRYYAEHDRLAVHGSEGILWVNRCTGHLLEEPAVVLYRDGETRAFHDLDTDWAASFRAGVHDFVDALRTGRQPAQNAEEARRTLAVALAVGRSAAEHREVTTDEVLAA